MLCFYEEKLKGRKNALFADLIESITDLSVFTTSIKDFFTGFSVSSLVMTILAVFMLVGLVDKMRGNRNGYGEKFDDGFQAMGDLALAVVGIVSLSPVLLKVLAPIVSPLYSLIGASPAMFPSILALDMGGYALATQMAGSNVAVGQYAGIIVASMLGITICFTIPYALTVMKEEDRPIFGMGILVGVITMPIGCIVGGLAMNLTSNPLTMPELLINTLPVIVLSILVAVGLIVRQSRMLKIFAGFGKGLSAIIAVSPGIAIFQYLTGVRIPLFNLMVEYDPVLDGVPLETGLLLVGLIAIVLTGAFPMIHFLNKRFGRAMNSLGNKIGIDSASSTGLLTQLASSIPVLSVIDTMNSRGKLINIAFAVSGSFVLGDVLAFTGGASPEMVFPVVAANLTGGILAIVLALVLLKFNVLKLGESPAGQ